MSERDSQSRHRPGFIESTDARQALGEALRRARDTAGMRQVDVAKKTGIADTQLSDWENARAAPNIFTLQALAKAYGISLDELVRSAPPEPYGFWARLGLELRSARDTAGLEQREVAEKIGIPPSTLSDYEGGARAPSVIHLVLRADAFNVSLDRLILGRDAVSQVRDAAPGAEELATVRALLKSARRILATEDVGMAATARALTILQAAEMLIEKQQQD
jgi:transcriptional regulator with XRE-family HTH domain